MSVNRLRWTPGRGILGFRRLSPAIDWKSHGDESNPCAEKIAPVIDASTLAELWDEHADRLLLIARSIGGPVEDAVQEAFVALASQRCLPNDPRAWLVRVTRNRLLQWHRGNQRRRRRESVAGSKLWFDCQEMSAQQRLDATEITEALQALPSPDREIIVMHLWGEMSFESIAAVVGGSRAKAHRAFGRGLETLQQKFNPDPMVAPLRSTRESFREVLK
jgi:RNA polymerase sigma factor (sigma-70 family)